MTLDSRRFLELTLLLSAAGCGPRAAPEPPAFVPLAPGAGWPSGSDSLDAGVTPAAPIGESPDASNGSAATREEPSCNDVGNASACSLLLPTCESGEAEACGTLGRLVRPKIVQRFAECVAKKQHGTCAPGRGALRGCLRAALETGCIDPSAEVVCRDLQARCQAAGKKPTYSVAACARVVSAARVKPGSADWADADLDLLGPADESGSCSLAGVFPQRPFAR